MVAVSAARQSGRGVRRVPMGLVPFAHVLETTTPGQGIILDPRADDAFAEVLGEGTGPVGGGTRVLETLRSMVDAGLITGGAQLSAFLADGDIGSHFPPTDPQWKGADSAVFLKEAVRRVLAAGYTISNVDSTVILEKPKLKDFRLKIRETLAATIGVELDRVSVKFKTAEQVGPVGELRASEAEAIVTLVR